ncbi:MAG: right-handed parallel beta-helix repeat-containing protein [Pseudomonadota bacterium]
MSLVIEKAVKQASFALAAFASAIGIGLGISFCTAFDANAATRFDGAWLERQIQNAADGTVIEIPAGDYDLKDVRIRKNITLRGAINGTQRPILRSAETTDKGVLVPQVGVSLRLENLVFRNTSSWDRNGAGVRHEGLNLTIVNCLFDSNEDGILATGDPNGVITITGTKFIDNGFGDGQSHAIYVLNASKVDIRDSEFIGTRIGHHVKSLARETVLIGNLMDDAYGRASYALDASKGGLVTVKNNKIIQSVDSDNSAILNYDLTRGGAAVGFTIEGNEIINNYNGGILLRNDTRIVPIIRDNTVKNNGGRRLKM